MTIALAMSPDQLASGGTDDDRLLEAALGRHGLETKMIAWDEVGFVWAGFSGVLIRACWDYHLRPAEFRTWLAAEHPEIADVVHFLLSDASRFMVGQTLVASGGRVMLP